MSSTVIIAISMILVIALIVWALVISAKRQDKKRKDHMTGRLQQLARDHNTNIDVTEFLGRKVIALNTTKEKVFYVDYLDDIASAVVIDLDDVVDCNLSHTGSKIIESSGNGKTKVEMHIRNIWLEITTKGGVKQNLMFYDEAKDGVLEMLPLKEKAEKWKKILSN